MKDDREKNLEEYKRIVAAVPEFGKIPSEEYFKTVVLIKSRYFFESRFEEKRLMIPLVGILGGLYNTRYIQLLSRQN